MNKLSILWIGLLLFASILAADKAAWKTRTIYQLLTDRFWRSNGDVTTPCDITTYCGGDWTGIQQQLQYVKDLGFDAIWISPTVDNYKDNYHGYAYQDWGKVNYHFGNEASLKKLVATAQSMGIWVMVDVVANHCAAIQDNFQLITPFNLPEHYHADCELVDNYNQTQREVCRLSGLADLDQRHPFVKSYLSQWIKDTVQTFNFDGIRIDTVPHVEKLFWPDFVASSGVFQIAEVFDTRDDYIADYQNYVDSTMNYPMFFVIKSVFANGTSMTQIPQKYALQDSLFNDVDALGLYVDNHDNPRFLSINSDWRLFKSSLAFALTARGVPILYYGSEQGFSGGADPSNREAMWGHFDRNHEIFKFTQTINLARAATKSFILPMVDRYVDDNLYIYNRGPMIVGLTNKVLPLQTVVVKNIGLPEGRQVCNIFLPTDCTQVWLGSIQFPLKDGEVKIFLPKDNSFFVSKKRSFSEHLKLASQ